MRGSSGRKTELFEQFLNESRCWFQQSSAGGNRLTKALSIALFFADIYAEQIQAQISSYFTSLNGLDGLRFFKNKTDVDEIAGVFLKKPHHSDFEALNLELFAALYEHRVELFFTHNGNLATSTYAKTNRSCIRVYRTTESDYFAIFSSETKEPAIFAQNIILSICDAIGSPAKPWQFAAHNKGKLINFSYKKSGDDFSAKLKAPNQNLTKSSDFSKQETKPASRTGFEFTDDTQKSCYQCNDPVIKQSTSKQNYRRGERSQLPERSNSSYNDSSSFLRLPHEDLSNIELLYDDVLNEEDHFSIFKPKRLNLRYIPFNSQAAANRDHPNNGAQNDQSTQGESNLTANSKNPSDRQIFDDEISIWKLNRICNPVKAPNNDPQTVDHTSMEYSIGNSTNQLSESGRTDDMGLPIQDNVNRNTLHDGALNSHRISREALQVVEEVKNIKVKVVEEEKVLRQKNNGAENLGKKVRGNTSNSSKGQEISDERVFQGRLKFFDDKNGFGFITVLHQSRSNEDIFVYRNEFEKSGIDIDAVKSAKQGGVIEFSFQIARYFGKYKESKKAINITVA